MSRHGIKTVNLPVHVADRIDAIVRRGSPIVAMKTRDEFVRHAVGLYIMVVERHNGQSLMQVYEHLAQTSAVSGSKPTAARPRASFDSPAPLAGKKRGRKPSPGTQKVIARMLADKADGNQLSVAQYVDILMAAEPKRSKPAAGIAVRREAKRIFGGLKAHGRRRRAGGRQPNPLAILVRKQIEKDQANGGVKDAKHYVRWLVDQPGVKIGLKPARPIVYRELRALKETA